MEKWYVGNCHCGAVRFEACLDLSAGTGKCNCSICAKDRFWSADAKPERVRLIRGEEELTDFRGNNPVAHHFFCRHCGIRPFQRVDLPNDSGAPYYNINVACLGGVDLNELLAAPITYYDGLHDNWGSAPAETRHL